MTRAVRALKLSALTIAGAYCFGAVFTGDDLPERVGYVIASGVFAFLFFYEVENGT